MTSLLPLEVILDIYKYCNIDTKISFHKIFDHNIFYIHHKCKPLVFENYTTRFINELTSFTKWRITHIEVLNFIERLSDRIES
jgi:hypothetical protein